MEKKRSEKNGESNAQQDDMNTIAPSSVACINDIIKEIPLPPQIPSSFSSFLSATSIAKPVSKGGPAPKEAVIDLTEAEARAAFSIQDIPVPSGSAPVYDKPKNQSNGLRNGISEKEDGELF